MYKYLVTDPHLKILLLQGPPEIISENSNLQVHTLLQCKHVVSLKISYM